MASLSTHVLDLVRGRPAAGVEVALATLAGDPVASGVTDDDGRIGSLGPADLAAGDYTVRFDTGAWFAATGTTGFYPEVAVSFTIAEGGGHHHVPLLLGPYGYSTYRGS